MEIETNTEIEIRKRKKGYVANGELIGNSNTGKLHSPGCKAIGMMKDNHKVPTDGAHFIRCHWCHVTASSISDIIQDQADTMEVKICRDPKIISLFNQEGCLTCGSHNGIVKMFPDSSGVRLLGEEGLWWIYFECDDCSYQTAWWKLRRGSK